MGVRNSLALLTTLMWFRDQLLLAEGLKTQWIPKEGNNIKQQLRERLIKSKCDPYVALYEIQLRDTCSLFPFREETPMRQREWDNEQNTRSIRHQDGMENLSYVISRAQSWSENRLVISVPF